ncbi:MAG: hypothetical protein A2261_02235 [Candidatus Magasanikbacteria bacterium RIFOXYA2_FULL_44_8]|uniref:TNase-like domain-containing protein n=1 Tax=Candidatus Magasanikbacteria bacterium RIFOXYA2_FULL_44_8 TaxID=1798696 RepID=A0A1F6NK10_9BACT|nr:MAG: hypothetical protein A2261_02235 [Candidatus Magasanikbacteria bacterium RIFOXYA2_FULL_44_8]
MLKKILVPVLILCLAVPLFCVAAGKIAKTAGVAVSEMAVVYYVTDGDTIKVKIKGKSYIVRLIGVDTPETKDPRKAVQCFGKEASDYTKKKLLNQTVTLISDPVSGNKDLHSRLLRYVFLADGTNFDHQLISDGYAYEYTYQSQLYRYRDDFKKAQQDARDNKRGLWADSACHGVASPVISSSTEASAANSPTAGCVIKGNISSREKIYHLPGCKSYDKTVIDEQAGEKWFCNEAEAVQAGWRKAKNC